MVESYRTISGGSEGSYKEKGSKFLAFAYPVMEEADVKAALARLQKEYFDARHHCYAYVLGASKDAYRANDDGEPNHSAGDPILGQIRSRDLTNVLVVVVRYFGGTKLGVGGLINAYKTASANALDNAEIIDVDVKNAFQLFYQYKDTSEIMRLLRELDASILSQTFEESCVARIEVKIGQVKTLKQRIVLLNDTGVDCRIEDVG